MTLNLDFYVELGIPRLFFWKNIFIYMLLNKKRLNWVSISL